MENKADGTPYTMHMGGIPIKIAYEFHEAATMQRRCYFDRNDLAKKLLILGDKEKLAQLSKDAIFSIADNCNYDDVAKKWAYVIENLPAKDRSKTWNKELDPATIPPADASMVQMPNVSDEDFVDWCYTAILRSTVDAVGRGTWIADLKAGRPRSDIVNYFLGVAGKDRRQDVLLLSHRQRLAQNIQIRQILSNPNLLQGLMIS